MSKSFGYNPETHNFYIARHQVGDFGLHISLIRSFSWGQNISHPESPFYPGKPLPYHYYFDFFIGMLERLGLRIDVALNSISTIAFASLLFLIYKLPQMIFGKNKILGLLSVILFIFHSNLTFLDFLKGKALSFSLLLSLLRDFWNLPDYINKGPFDGSIISIFFTMNVFLNQRHLIVALVISLGLLYFLLPRLMGSRSISTKAIILISILLGISSRVHTLIFFSSFLIILLLFIFFKRIKLMLPFLIPSLLIFSFHLIDIASQQPHPLLNPGFLSQKPLTLDNFLTFWFLNLGVAFFLIPLGFFVANSPQKRLFLAILAIFVIGNIFQLGFRIDHNHSLFNLFLIFANFYIAFFLLKLWEKRTLLKKFLSLCLLLLLILSGIIDLMAVKNDFRYPLALGDNDPLIRWIRSGTKSEDIFLSRGEILDPITFSGRKNYFGHKYYLEVMGYDFEDRQELVKTFFEANRLDIIDRIRNEKIRFMVVPKKKLSDFNYNINIAFLRDNLNIAYEDEETIVFSIYR